MKSLTKLLVLTATIAMAGWMNSASATFLSFGITGTGSYTVNTGNITALTATKHLAAVETVGACIGDPGACTTFILGGPVVFSTLTLNTTVGADVFSITAGGVTFSFTNVSSVLIVPSGANTAGAISEQLNGTVTSAGAFSGQTVSISETCTQANIGAIITCSESVTTPGVPINVPEPMSLALLGIGLAGLGFASRRRKS